MISYLLNEGGTRRRVGSVIGSCLMIGPLTSAHGGSQAAVHGVDCEQVLPAGIWGRSNVKPVTRCEEDQREEHRQDSGSISGRWGGGWLGL